MGCQWAPLPHSAFPSTSPLCSLPHHCSSSLWEYVGLCLAWQFLLPHYTDQTVIHLAAKARFGKSLWPRNELGLPYLTHNVFAMSKTPNYVTWCNWSTFSNIFYFPEKTPMTSTPFIGGNLHSFKIPSELKGNFCTVKWQMLFMRFHSSSSLWG